MSAPKPANHDLDSEVTELRAQTADLDAKLHEVRDILAAVLDQTTDSVVLCNLQGRITFANAAACRLAGMNPTGMSVEAALDSWGTVYYADGTPIPPEESSLLPIFGGETRVEQEVYVLGGDGGRVDLLASARPLCDAFGRAIGAVVTLSDITARKQTDEALAEQNARLRTAMEDLQTREEVVATQNEELRAMVEELRVREEESATQNDELEASVGALVEEKNRLEAVMQSLPVGVALVDDKGGHIQSNAAFEQVWGGPRPPARSVAEYARYRAWWAGSGEGLRPEEWASARAVRHGETVVNQDLEIERFDGARAFVLNSAAPIRDAKGRVVGAAVAIQDVTALRRAEQALRESEERYRTLFDTMTEGFALCEIVLDEAGRPCDYRFLDANPAFERLTGLNRDNLLGKRVREVLPDVESYWIESFGRVAESGEPAHFDNYAADLQRWYEVLAYRTAPGRFAVVFSDITARKRAEVELEKHRQHIEELVAERTVELQQTVRLVESERKRFRDVLDQLPAYLVLLSPDYRVPFANRFFEERFGKSHGRKCHEYLFQRNEPCDNCESFKVLQTGQPHHWYWTGPDGCDYDIYDFPFTDADGAPLIMEVGLDITERRAAEAEVNRYRRHLEDLVAERAGQLVTANEQLQAEVAERTRAEASLRAINEELTRFNRAMVDREIRMIELKKQVNALCTQLGQPPRYALDFEKEKP